MNQVIPWNLIEEEEKKCLNTYQLWEQWNFQFVRKKKNVTELHKYTTFLSNKPPLDLLSLHILT